MFSTAILGMTVLLPPVTRGGLSPGGHAEQPPEKAPQAELARSRPPLPGYEVLRPPPGLWAAHSSARANDRVLPVGPT